MGAMQALAIYTRLMPVRCTSIVIQVACVASTALAQQGLGIDLSDPGGGTAGDGDITGWHHRRRTAGPRERRGAGRDARCRDGGHRSQPRARSLNGRK
jgi:hypothetical protein